MPTWPLQTFKHFGDKSWAKTVASSYAHMHQRGQRFKWGQGWTPPSKEAGGPGGCSHQRARRFFDALRAVARHWPPAAGLPGHHTAACPSAVTDVTQHGHPRAAGCGPAETTPPRSGAVPTSAAGNATEGRFRTVVVRHALAGGLPVRTVGDVIHMLRTQFPTDVTASARGSFGG